MLICVKAFSTAVLKNIILAEPADVGATGVLNFTVQAVLLIAINCGIISDLIVFSC